VPSCSHLQAVRLKNAALRKLRSENDEQARIGHDLVRSRSRRPFSRDSSRPSHKPNAPHYLDQNALIALGVRARRADFRRKMDKVICSGAMTVVVSSWHLIESANTTNLANAVELAEFIDSLKPTWLLERRNIQKLDVQEDFWRFLKLDFPHQPRVTTRSAVIAVLNGQADAPKFDISSRAFVEQWIKHPDQLAVLKKAYANNAIALTAMRKATKEGKITEEIRRRTDRELVRGLLAAATPAGVAVGPEVVRRYLESVDLSGIPSLAIETAIADHEWGDVGGADRNTLIDKFHLISALPYVDEIVSGDRFFQKIVPVVTKTGHVKATFLGNAEFLARF
jgi:hypothetical protein